MLVAAIAVTSCWLVVDWPSVFGRASDMPPVAAPAHPPMTPEGRAFLERQYEVATLEIRQRLGDEHGLFVLKFSVVGAMLGLIFTADVFQRRSEEVDQAAPVHPAARRLRNPAGLLIDSPLATATCWSAVIASAIVDARILFNIEIIKALGAWIRTRVEPALMDSAALGWENHLRGLFDSWVYPVIRVSAHLLTVMLFLTVVSVYRWAADQPTRGAATQVCWSCRAGATGVFVVLLVVNLHHMRGSLWWTLIGLCAAALGTAAVWVLWRATPCAAR